jgi:hypothetical protein
MGSQACGEGGDIRGELRVTMIFRLEEAGWKLIHRQAGPFVSPQPLERLTQKS